MLQYLGRGNRVNAPGPWHDHQLYAPHTPQPTTKTRRFFVSVCSPYLTVSQSGFKSTRVTIQGWQSLPRRTPKHSVKWGPNRTSGSTPRPRRLTGVELSSQRCQCQSYGESYFVYSAQAERRWVTDWQD